MKAPRFKVNDFPKHIREQIERKLSGGKTAHPFTDVEQDSGNGSLGQKKAKGHDTPCRIAVHSIRQRLADMDGISAKAAIDGLVHCEILKDDSPKYVKEVSYSQEKGKKEETIITLTW